LIDNYTALGENGFVPPDTCGAAGPTSYVETINLDLAIFTSKTTNTPSVTDSLSDFFFTQGGLPRASGSSGLSDPITVWDDLANRFIVGVQDVDNSNHVSTFDLAVSRSASPATLTTADWFFYQVNTTEANHDSDYPGNFGYNADAFVFTLRQFGFGGASTQTEVTAIKTSDLVAGNALVTSGAGQNVFQSDLAGIDYRPTVMHDSVSGDPMWLFNSSRGGGTTILVEKMSPVLSTAPVFTPTTLNVNAYSSAVVPLNPDGTSIIPGRGKTFTGILKAAEFNNNIVASDTTAVGSTEDDVRWYRIDVSSGTPTLADQGNVSAGNNTYLCYGAIDINSHNDIGLVYQQSGTDTPTDFMSTFVTGRLASDPAGTMQTPVLVPSGTGTTNNTDGREGDLCGINVDSTPLTVTAATGQFSDEGASQSFSLGSFADLEGDFWAAGEFSTTGGVFGTAVGHFAAFTTKAWTVDVSWGDSTPDTTFSASSMGDLGSQSHTYGEEGTFTVMVKVTDTSDGHSDTKSFTVVVSDPAVLAAGVNVSTKECIAFNLPAATFTDPGGAEPNPSDPIPGISSHYTATVDFGDGKGPVAATISYSGTPGSTTGVFTVNASHSFDEEGTFTVTTTINHEGSTPQVVTSTATVRDNYGLLLLDPTGTQSLMVTGNGSVTVNNCGAIVVDSSDPQAIFLTGNAVATATEADVGLGGGFITHGKAVLNLLEPEFNQEAATPDPIALPLPPAPAVVSATPLHISSGAVTLSPGTYVGGIAIDGTAAVTLLPGVYFMNGGGFSVSGHGSVTGTGVLLVNAPAKPSDVISITGQGSVSLTASSTLTGAYAPYDHIVIFQDPASANTVTVAGQASLTASGTLYAPAALLMISGNGTAVVSTDTNPTGGQVIVFDAKVTGNGVLTINADPAGPVAIAAAPVSASLGADDNSLRQVSLVLTGGQSLAGVSLPSPLVAPAPAGTPAATPSAAGAAYLFNTGTTAVALSGASAGGQADDWLAASLDAPSDQLRAGL
jgi:hypothetical protein